MYMYKNLSLYFDFLGIRFVHMHEKLDPNTIV